MPELRLTAGLNNVTRNLDYQVTNIEVTTSTNERLAGDLTINTSETTLDISSLTTPGWARFLNLDATNFVKLGFSTGVYGIRLPADSDVPNLIQIDPAIDTLYLIADTAACIVEYEIFGA